MQNKTLKITCAIVGLTLSACGDSEPKNLSAADFPTPPSSNFVQDAEKIYAAEGFCDDNGCKAYYPSALRDEITYRPLTDQVGMATYSVEIQVAIRRPDGNRTYSSRTVNPIMVNFDNNTISWSGEIRQSGQVDLRGNFNRRGQITGTANVAGFSQGYLIGLISRGGMVGSFTNDDGDFGGGFNANLLGFR